MDGSKPVLLMTRPRSDSDRFVHDLPGDLLERLTVTISPLMKIENLLAVPDLSDVKGLIFTSGNAVTAANILGIPRHLPVYCVGQATTKAARAAGWDAECSGQTAQELLDALKIKRPETPLMHLSGEHIRVDIAGELSQSGLESRNCPIYTQMLQDLTAETKSLIKSGRPLVAPLFSPRTSRHFALQIKQPDRVFPICLSDAVAAELGRKRWAEVKISEHPTAESVRRDTVALLRRLTRVEGNHRAQ